MKRPFIMFCIENAYSLQNKESRIRRKKLKSWFRSLRT